MALWHDGDVVERRRHAPNQHAEILLAMIDDVLEEAETARAQLDVVALGRGPGAFTGLRIGAAVAQGLAFGCDIPVVTVSSLQALAQAQTAPHVLAAIDARMHQVYWACYRRIGDTAVAVAEERLTSPQSVTVRDADHWLGVGSGWDRYTAELDAALAGVTVEHRFLCHPGAKEIARLGAGIYAREGGLPAEQALPHYLRDKIVG